MSQKSENAESDEPSDDSASEDGSERSGAEESDGGDRKKPRRAAASPDRKRDGGRYYSKGRDQRAQEVRYNEVTQNWKIYRRPVLNSWPIKLTVRHQCEQCRQATNCLPCLESSDGHLFQLLALCPTCKLTNEDLQKNCREERNSKARYGRLGSMRYEQECVGTFDGTAEQAVEYFYKQLKELKKKKTK